MKRIKKIKAWLFGVQYRLTVIGAEYWSLYKTGPFGLPEREVDFGYSREEAEKE